MFLEKKFVFQSKKYMTRAIVEGIIKPAITIPNSSSVYLLIGGIPNSPCGVRSEIRVPTIINQPNVSNKATIKNIN